MKQLSRVLAGVLALALCLWMAPALAESYVVVSSDAHVRSGPGLNYDSLDVMRAGEKAGYLENSSVDSRGVTWYKVNYGSVTGWVSSKYAAVKQGGTNSGFFTGESDSYVKVSGGDAHVRSGPGLNYDSLEVMHAGETAVYLDDSSVDSRGVAWYKVKYDGVTG